MAGMYQDAFRPWLDWVFPKEKEKIEISLIENEPKFHISREFDKTSNIVAGIRNKYSGIQINEGNQRSSHGTSFEFMLYAQPTNNVAKEPIIVENINLIVDHSEEDVIYSFPHGPREMTFYHEKEITLEPGKNIYEISTDQYKLQEGQSDSFKVKISSSIPQRYIAHIEVVWWRPSEPSKRQNFQSRQYQLSFPEIRKFSELLNKHLITSMHVSEDQLYGVIGFERWLQYQKPENKTRVIIPGYHYYFPERQGPGTRFFDAANRLTNPFFNWWKENPDAVLPGGYSLEYGEGYIGEPNFNDSYIIFDDALALLKNRGDYATLYENSHESQAVLDHFDENWKRGKNIVARFPDTESFLSAAELAISQRKADLELVYISRFFPTPISAKLLTNVVAFGDKSKKSEAIESLGILGLGHERGVMIKNLHEYLVKYSAETSDEEIKKATEEILQKFDLPPSAK